MIKSMLCAAACVISATAGQAQDTTVRTSAAFMFDAEQVTIARDPAQASALVAQVSAGIRPCETACLGSVVAAPGVKTLGESEVLSFLMDKVAMNTGLMVDARMPEDRAGGHIPGSVSLPYTTVDPENAYRFDILRALGAETTAEGLRFDAARHLLVYDVGPAADDAGMLVRHLLAAGYPAERVSYYRGGMLLWAALGFTVTAGSGS